MVAENTGNTPSRPLPPSSEKLEWGSDAVAWTLRSLPIDFIALNPGASYRGLHDSLVNVLEDTAPEMLVCLHEEHAVAMAHGYAKVTGRPMAVALHSNVGLMHGSMAIYNAWCDRAPMLILGANGPVDANLRRPWIDWIHTSQDQAALIRPFIKWDNQPASVEAAMESILRAWQATIRQPRGPVYICLDVSLQEKALDKPLSLPDPTRFMPGEPPVPSAKELDTAANMIRKARNPVILAGRVSRSSTDWGKRIELAEKLGATVMTDLKIAAAFPTDHLLHPLPPAFRLDNAAIQLLSGADLIISLDWLDLGGTLYTVWPDGKPSAKIIHASLDDYAMNGWAMNHQRMAPVDLALDGTPESAVDGLLERIESTATIKVQNAHKRPAMPQQTGAFDLLALATTLTSTLNDREVSYLRLPLGWPSATNTFKHPLDYLGYDGGAGIGSGPGMVIGSALGLKGSSRLPVAVLGDGDLMMGANALWTAARYGIPVLIIVANNRGYYNDVAHQEAVAINRNRDVENKWVGQRLDDPAIDLASIARAQGFQAEGPILDERSFKTALEKAITTVENGQPALLDVVVKAGYMSGVVDFNSDSHSDDGN
ncbi:thiamine pyrophosphate-binding protein [Marinobacter sp. TBZ242]|uniref:Thiamine pyrophosphate-binding protein n=1 Tax=Marinobacter azerbaijanicus TaxID=3050455 RepID=A0ABT7IJC5_9GAMM|nr:thiamine pyrophosphate-binding protein [Marinobacter sp. TBZ242]MDL0433263.1 thiamine pyrophosphate-binding protein [Marinobacter sp. TBZ242]